MEDNRRNLRSDNAGSALITALVVGVVLLVLCLSLLLVSYSHFSKVNEDNLELPGRELIYSAVEEFEQELFNAGGRYGSEDEMSSYFDSGEDGLWKFVRCNLWQQWDSNGQSAAGSNWLYYDPSETGHDNLENCSKYFRIDTGRAGDKLTVQLYWELPDGYTGGDGDKKGTVLHAVFRLYDGDSVVYKTGRSYQLDVTEIEPIIAAQYTVSFDSNGHGQSPLPQSVIENDTAVLPLMLPVEGYTFKGWYTKPECTDESRYDFNTPVTKDFTLYAGWEAEKYTVTFDVNGHGTAPSPQRIEYLQRAVRPEDPKTYGFVFKGWYTVESCTDGTEFDFSTHIKKDTILYAKWIPATFYTVSFDLNDSSLPKIPDQSVAEGECAVEPDEPHKNKMNFAGWYTNAACDDDKFYSFTTPVTEDIILYAKWTNGYVVTFYANNDLVEAVGIPEPQIYAKTDKCNPPANPYDALGCFVFEKWYTDPECTHSYNFNAAITANVNLYAKWRRVAYRVKFISDTYNNTVYSEGPVLIGERAVKPADPVKAAYDFAGWYTDGECTDGNEWDFNSVITDSDITLYAGMTPTVYDIVYVLDGGTNSPDNPATYTVLDEITLKEPSKGPESTFIGWFSTPEATTAGRVTGIPAGSTGTKTVYAVWVTTTFNVTYFTETSMGTVNTIVEYDEKAAAPAVTRKGYKLIGWYSDEKFTKAWDFGTGVREHLTLFAKWEKEEYTVTFDSNGGSSVPSQKVKYNEYVLLPSEPVRNGYNFAGWFAKPDLSGETWNFTGSAVTENITLYAKWTQKLVVNFVTRDTAVRATMPQEQIVNEGTVISKPADPTDECFKFIDWYTDEALSVKWDFSKPVTKSMTLYAKWERRNYRVTFDYGTSREPYEVIVSKGNRVSKPTITVPRYTVVGYYSDAAFKNSWNFSTKTVNADTVIYVKLELTRYTVTFNGNKPDMSWFGLSGFGGLAIYAGIYVSSLPSSQSVVADGLAYEPDVPYLEGALSGTIYGYFIGWYSDAACTIPWDFRNNTVNGNITLYAGWCKASDVNNRPEVSQSEKDRLEVEFNLWYASNRSKFEVEFFGFTLWEAKDTAWKYWYNYIYTGNKSAALDSGTDGEPALLLMRYDDRPMLFAAGGEEPGGVPGGEPGGGTGPLYIYPVPEKYIPKNSSVNPCVYTINPREIWHWSRLEG